MKGYPRLALPPCHISFFGPLQVTSPDGDDLTPRSAKSRALLALLADYPRVRRSRRWVESKLWSDRAPQQASGSLRQVLTEIRIALGANRGMLNADRLDIWLDPACVTSDLDPDQSPMNAHREILEGLDTRDPEFEVWQSNLRRRLDQEPKADKMAVSSGVPRGLRVRRDVSGSSKGIGRVVAGVLADQVGQNLEESLSAWRSAQAVGDSDLEVAVDVAGNGDHTLATVRVVHLANDQVLFSGYRNLPAANGSALSDQLVAEFAHEASSRTIAKLPQAAQLDRDEIIAIGFAEIAKRRIFSYESEELASADALLERAFDVDPNGIYLGWQAFQRTTQVIEGLADFTPELRDETEGLIRKAEEMSPQNGHVHALVALVRLLFFDDAQRGLQSSEAGFRRNPNGLFVRQCLAMTAGAFGNEAAAYETSLFCRPALKSEEARHLWDLYHGLVCISTGRFAEAKGALEMAVRSCPGFKAPHRQLIALNSHLGEHDDAAESLRALQALEPDFSMDRYMRDPDYPVTTLRKAGLLHQPFDSLPH